MPRSGMEQLLESRRFLRCHSVHVPKKIKDEWLYANKDTIQISAKFVPFWLHFIDDYHR